MGFYLPFGKLVTHEGPAGREALQMWHVGSVAAGARISAIRGDWELAVGATYTPSLVAVRTLDATRDVGSNLLMTSVRLLWRPEEAAAERIWGIYLGPGVSWLNRWGRAWEAVDDTRDVGGLLTVGTRGRLPELAPSVFRLGVTVWLYRTDFRDSERGGLGRGLQSELVLSAGFSVPIN